MCSNLFLLTLHLQDMKSTIQSLKDSLAEQSKHMALTIKAMDGLKRTMKEFQVPVYTWEYTMMFFNTFIPLVFIEVAYWY